MKQYRINKVTAPNGKILTRKDILAQNDKQAMDRAEDDADCPVCDVLHAGERIGSVT